MATRLVSNASPTLRPSSPLLFDKRTPNHPRAHSDLHHVVDAHDARNVHFLLVEHVPGEQDNAEEVSHRKTEDDLGLDEEVQVFVLLEPHPVGRVHNARELSPHLARVRLDRFHFVDCQGVDEGTRKLWRKYCTRRRCRLRSSLREQTYYSIPPPVFCSSWSWRGMRVVAEAPVKTEHPEMHWCRGMQRFDFPSSRTSQVQRDRVIPFH